MKPGESEETLLPTSFVRLRQRRDRTAGHAEADGMAEPLIHDKHDLDL